MVLNFTLQSNSPPIGATPFPPYFLAQRMIVGSHPSGVYPNSAADIICRLCSGCPKRCTAFIGQRVSHHPRPPQQLRCLPCCAVKKRTRISSPIRATSCHFNCKSVVQHSCHRPAYHNHTDNGLAVICSYLENRPDWWPMMPMVPLDELARLGKRHWLNPKYLLPSRRSPGCCVTPCIRSSHWYD